MGSVTVTKDEEGRYQFKVSFFGKIINWVADKIKERQDRNKPPEEKREFYGKYHKDDRSRTSVWWPDAEKEFKKTSTQRSSSET
jgi:hypothetical protein